MPKYNQQDVLKTDLAYKRNIKRWRFLNASFEGGEEYYRGQYLRRYKSDELNPGKYERRLAETCLDNQCERIINAMNDMMFRPKQDRDFGSIENDPIRLQFMDNCDYNGTPYESFVKDAVKESSKYGLVYVKLSRPEVPEGTRRTQADRGIRPYLTMIPPTDVLEVKYEKSPFGGNNLCFIKYIEERHDDYEIFVIMTKERIERFKVKSNQSDFYNQHKGHIPYDTAEYDFGSVTPLPDESADNLLKEIPIIVLYNEMKSDLREGRSMINDEADIQHSIYQDYSDASETTKVAIYGILKGTKAQLATAALGPGGKIEVDAGAGSRNTDGEVKHYDPSIITPSTQPVSSIVEMVKLKTETIERNSGLNAISGVHSYKSEAAKVMEQKALDGKLENKADRAANFEDRHWKLWCLIEGHNWDGKITYQKSFNIQDTARDIQNAKELLNIITTYPDLATPTMIDEIRRTLANVAANYNQEKLDKILSEIEKKPMNDINNINETSLNVDDNNPEEN